MLKTIENNPPYWMNEKLLDWQEDELEQRKPFADVHYWNHSTSINPFLIVGTDHPDYQGKTWKWLIYMSKIMEFNLDLYERNKVYYQEAVKKSPPMYYISINGLDWYVHGDGNHRSCISRFHNHIQGEAMLHGVSILDWRINQYLFDLYQDIQSIIQDRHMPFSLSTQRKTLKRDDGPGWQKEYYNTFIILKSSQRIWHASSIDEAQNMKVWLQSSTFRRWLTIDGFKKVQTEQFE